MLCYEKRPLNPLASVLRAKLASVPLATNERDIVALGGPELRALARRKAVLGHVPALLAGESRLTTPVYVIWGEEDDLRVIERLRTAPNKVRFVGGERRGQRVWHLLDE